MKAYMIGAEIFEPAAGVVRFKNGVVDMDSMRLVRAATDDDFEDSANGRLSVLQSPSVAEAWDKLAGVEECPHYCDNQGYCHMCGASIEPTWHEYQ